MATSLTKMFVNYKGDKASFISTNGPTTYANQIVFINGGECIFAKGNYYGSVSEALAALKYFSSVKVGEKVATAAGPNGTLTFAATDPTSLAVDVDARGITIGLKQEFIDKVNNAAVKADVDAELESINAAIEALEAWDADTRLKALEDAIGVGEEGEDQSVTAKLAALSTRISDEETRAKGVEAGLQTAVDGKVAQTEYDAKVLELNNAISANTQALEVLNGEGDGSVKKAVADGIAGVVASAPEDFDTLKEVADWIASDTSGAAKMQSDIARLDGADTVEGSVKKQVKDAVAAEAAIARAAEQANATAASEAKTAAEGAQSHSEGVAEDLTEHIADTVKHITAAERTAWNAAEQNAKNYADSLASNYDSKGSAAQALADAKVYTDALANGAVATNTTDIDAIEAFLNDPWLEL